MKKVAFITGGSSGLGLAIVEQLLRDGYEVVSISKSEEKIERAKRQLKSDKVSFLVGDITEERSLELVYQYLFCTYGQVNVVINNVGIMIGGGIEDISVDQWKDMFEVNVHVPYRVTKKLLRLLKHAERASVINISSIASKITGGCIGYSATKAALDMMTQSLAKELAEYYIRVNSVNPGIMNTGFQVNNRMMKYGEYEEFLEKASVDYPMGIGTATDVSNLVSFLISDKAGWITGANYIIDGGRSVNL